MNHPEFDDLCKEYERKLVQLGWEANAVKEFCALCHPEIQNEDKTTH